MASDAPQGLVLRAGTQVQICGRSSAQSAFGVVLGPAGRPGLLGYHNVILASGDVKPFRTGDLWQCPLKKGDRATVVGLPSSHGAKLLSNGQQVQLLECTRTQGCDEAWQIHVEASTRRSFLLRAANLVRLPATNTRPEPRPPNGPPPWRPKRPPPTLSLAEALQRQLESLRQPAEFYECCEAALKDLRHLVTTDSTHAGPELVAFGSFVQGTCCEGSDLDVALVASGVQDAEVLKRVSARISSEKCFTVMQEIFTARIPVLKLEWRCQSFGSSFCPLEVDLSIGDERRAASDLSLASFLSMELLGRDTAVLLKAWAKRRGVQGAWEGRLSSYCWTMLVLFSLRRARFSGIVSATLEESLRAVFLTVLELEKTHDRGLAVDPVAGSLVRRPCSRGRGSPPLFIIDRSDNAPCTQGFPSNAARCLTWEGWKDCLAEARRAVSLLIGAKVNPDQVAAELFERRTKRQQRLEAHAISSDDQVVMVPLPACHARGSSAKRRRLAHGKVVFQAS